jgi:hypothetical protein
MWISSDARLKNSIEAVNQQMAILKSDMAAERERLAEDNRRLKRLVSETKTMCDQQIANVREEMEKFADEAEREIQRLDEERASAERNCEELRGVSMVSR